jgi:hypothetical protein
MPTSCTRPMCGAIAHEQRQAPRDVRCATTPIRTRGRARRRCVVCGALRRLRRPRVRAWAWQARRVRHALGDVSQLPLSGLSSAPDSGTQSNADAPAVDDVGENDLPVGAHLRKLPPARPASESASAAKTHDTRLSSATKHVARRPAADVVAASASASQRPEPGPVAEAAERVGRAGRIGGRRGA